MPEHDSSAFISYSREDSEFALRLAQDLKAAGAYVWLDQIDISPGVPWDNAIEDALNASPMMLLVLSPSSSRSNNVRNEISFALEAGKIVIPVLYQDCIVPLRLQRNQRIDFRADYAHGLATLLTYLHVQNPDPEVLERAANGDAQRRAAWEAREAQAEKLRDRQKLEEEDDARLREDAERQRQEQADAERLRAIAAQQAIDEAKRQAEAERVSAERRKADEAAARQLREMVALQETIAPILPPAPAEKREQTYVPPPPRKPEPPTPPIELKPSPGLDDQSGKQLIPRRWQPGVTIAVLVSLLVIAIIVIVAISNSHPTTATIVTGNGGVSDPANQAATPPATQSDAGTVTTPSAAQPNSTPVPKRPTTPNANAKQQFALSQSLGKQGNWVAAARAGELALSQDPQSEDILQYLSFIDHEQLFKFERAYELDQMRLLLGYGQDDFVEANLTASRFASCVTLAEADGRAQTEARLKIVMTSLQFACLYGEKNILASAAGSQLLKEISGLKAVGWTFYGTEHFVKTSPVYAPNGNAWASLFQALTNGDERTADASLSVLGITH